MPFRPPMWIISNKRQLNTWCGWSYHHLPLDHDTESSVDAVLVFKGSSRFRGTTRTCASPGAEDSRPATPLLINDHSSSYGDQEGPAHLGSLSCTTAPCSRSSSLWSSLISCLQTDPDKSPCVAQGLAHSRQYSTVQYMLTEEKIGNKTEKYLIL